MTRIVAKSVPKMFEEALALHQGGKLREAEIIYREILAREPRHHQTLHFFGVLAHQCNQNLMAIEMIRKAIALEPKVPEYHNNCGAVYYALGKLEDAGKCYARAVELNPDFPPAHNNLGNVLRDQGRLEEARVCYEKALQLDRNMVAAYNNLGNIEKDTGHPEKALELYQKALRLDPNYAEANNNVGNSLKDEGKLEEAAAHYRKAIKASPYFADPYNNLGVILRTQGQAEEALKMVHKAIELRPNFADAHNNLGLLLKEKGRYVDAIVSFAKAVELKPDYFPAFNNLGIAFHELGKLPEAIDCYEKALAIEPDKSFVHSNMLFTFNHHPAFTPEMMLDEHLQWAGKHGRPATSAPAFGNARDPNRRLRIGYVSPDFRRHVVAFNMKPVMAAHDHAQVEIFCYSSVARPDAVTEEFRAMADQWRDVAHVPDDQLRQLILADEIDILIDLTGHTGESRIRVFTERCAPVQVSYLGYVSTTGLATMDYRVSDAYGDPPGMTEKFYTEKMVRVPGSAIVYELPVFEIPTVPTPALKSGHVTFGSFNNLSKITPEVVALWSEILKAVPGSRLVLKTHCLSDPEVQKHVAEMFAHHEILRGRLEMLSYVPGYRDHLELYGRIDIGLDPFPFNGGVTSFESLWMGVPFVTLAGNTFVSRLGVRQLECLGMTDWIVSSKGDYVKKAVEAASNPQALDALRQAIRPAVQASALVDGPALARNLEAALRQMWVQVC